MNVVLPCILSLRERVLFQTFYLKLHQEICRCDRSIEGKTLLAVICKLCLALKEFTIKVARVYSPSRHLPSEFYMNLEEVVRNAGAEEVLRQLLGLGHTDDRSNLHYCAWPNPKS